ncbi:hypothetical protein Taro_005835, partial [Colocasia esculenta]|nr:hypothetical protein [Colocasia esculenta]
GTIEENQQPTLLSIICLLDTLACSLERAAEEKSVLLNKIENINELSRQEVDEIIRTCKREDCITSSDNIRKRMSQIPIVGLSVLAVSSAAVLTVLAHLVALLVVTMTIKMLFMSRT